MVKKSKPGNSIYLDVRVWYDGKKGDIHMTAKDVKGFHISVIQDPGSRRGHPTLFDRLAQCLRDNDAPAPAKVTRDS